MKKILCLLLTTVFVCSCYNDDDLWNKVNDLNGRVETLETTVQKMNSDITTLQEMVNVLNQGKIITNTEQTANGYTLTFNDGSKVSILNGKNGENGQDGKDAPVIGIKKDTDGVYYWTLTTNGVTEWLPDAAHKMKVSGENGAPGVTPTMGVDSEGYWTVDLGKGPQRLNGADGQPVKALGKEGDSFFQSVTNNETNVEVVLKNGTQITLLKGEAYTFVINQADNNLFHSNESKTYPLTVSNVDDITLIATPQGWQSQLTDKELKVTAPTVAGEEMLKGEFKLLVTPKNAFSKVIKLPVQAVREIRVLTFEDEDYKASPNYVGQSNWTSLIDTPQYGGPLLYPKEPSAQVYNWNDENHTLLASALPDGWGDKQYWGGGHAISNYVEMDIKKGDFNHQLAVYYKDPSTGFGGHNGSKNFCVHYGYMDDSGYANGPLPYLYFMDGSAHVIHHMYVTMNTYLANTVANGNGLTAPAGKNDWVKLVAIGYNESGEEVPVRPEIYLVGPNGNITEWTKWDLSAMGKVMKVDFNVTGSNDNGFGFSQPAYFCYDDVAVQF